MKKGFIIAATSSGSGKTTLSLGLMKYFSDRGFSVMPYKCGPDYIDTIYHQIATGTQSINLDLFMASENHVKSLFDHYAGTHEINIVEGAMGMFDGYDGMHGSAADLAIKLDLPVVLLINSSSTAYSVGATIYGFTHFNKDVKIAGVIFNKVASDSHYAFLKKACEDVGIPSLGYLKKNEKLQVPSRHLGLSLESQESIKRFIDEAAGEISKSVDIEKLVRITDLKERTSIFDFQKKKNLKVAVAFDEAFNFIYPVNIESFNCEIIKFSPLRDSVLPEVDLVYLPGGYPELYSDTLEKNIMMRKAIKDFAEKGGKILAECGGMIYLTEEIDGIRMCGVLPLKTTMSGARLNLGYRRVRFPNLEIRGHEFHYSMTFPHKEIPSYAKQYNAVNKEVETPVYRYKNVIASYTHLYWGETDIFKLWE